MILITCKEVYAGGSCIWDGNLLLLLVFPVRKRFCPMFVCFCPLQSMFQAISCATPAVLGKRASPYVCETF